MSSELVQSHFLSNLLPDRGLAFHNMWQHSLLLVVVFLFFVVVVVLGGGGAC